MGRSVERGAWLRRRTARIVGAFVVVVAAIVGVGVAARAWFDTRDETERTEATLHDTRDELARTRDDLDTADVQLEEVRTTLDDELATLGVRRSERDAAQEALDAASLVLVDLEAQLEAATADLEDRTTHLDALDRCLLGVAEALNQAAVGDTGGLAATVSGIEGTCAEAGAEL
jgi:chromosome segregation ATPase